MDDMRRGPLVARTYANGSVEPVNSETPRRRPSTTDGPTYIELDMNAAVLAPSVLSSTQMRVLHLVLTLYRHNEPWAHLTVAGMARELGISRQNMHKAVADLMARNLLYRSAANVWSVNPYYGWRGTRKQWEAERKNWEEPTWLP